MRLWYSDICLIKKIPLLTYNTYTYIVMILVSNQNQLGMLISFDYVF